MSLPLDEYIHGWKSRARRQREGEARLREELVARAREGARLLVERYGAHRVTLFGSLARGDRLDQASDVDLLVEGLPEAVYWEALDRVTLRVGRAVDLIPAERADPSLVERGRREGQVLYES